MCDEKAAVGILAAPVFGHLQEPSVRYKQVLPTP